MYMSDAGTKRVGTLNGAPHKPARSMQHTDTQSRPSLASMRSRAAHGRGVAQLRIARATGQTLPVQAPRGLALACARPECGAVVRALRCV